MPINLAKLFDDINERYFGGRLPKYRIRLCKRFAIYRATDRNAVKHGAVGLTDRKRRLIQIGAGMDATSTVETLLHEMVHASVGYGHGKRFEAELERIKAMGAPITENPPQLVTAPQVRGGIENAMMDGASLREAQEWVARKLRWTRAKLLGRFPRASQGR